MKIRYPLQSLKGKYLVHHHGAEARNKKTAWIAGGLVEGNGKRQTINARLASRFSVGRRLKSERA